MNSWLVEIRTGVCFTDHSQQEYSLIYRKFIKCFIKIQCRIRCFPKRYFNNDVYSQH